MGAGKTTIGAEVASRTGRELYDVDDAIASAHGPIWELFQKHGEAAFRELEAQFVREACSRREPAVIAVGGGAVETRDLLDELDVFVVQLDVDVDTAWARVQGSRRPLAQDEAEFRRRYEIRRPLYADVADAVATDADGVLLAGLGIAFGADAVDGDAVIADEHVLELHPPTFHARSVHTVPRGEAAKDALVVERLWNELTLGRNGTIVGYGGGSTTDVAGFVAATYLRGVRWVAVPTTLVGQVDAAIGGKTAIDLPAAKNLVGAFHYPTGVFIDPAFLGTLPAEQRREGMAEVVKTGLLAGRPLWELDDEPMIRACAAYKAAVCLADPFDRGRRAILNLGHTFAHALEAAADYRVAHGSAVALGLLAALRLSARPTDVVEELLQPQPVPVDRERAWTALQRDKKQGLVLLDDDGPRWNVQLPDADVRRALDQLIAD